VRLLSARIEPSPQVQQVVEKTTNLYEQFIKLSQSLNYDTMMQPRGWMIRRGFPTRLRRICSFRGRKNKICWRRWIRWRLNRIGDILEIELEKLNVDRNINTRVKRQMERAQKSIT